VSDDLDAVVALHDPVRRALYDYVVAQEAGVSRTLAAFHLDKLAEAGLLEVDFMRLTEARPGPGGGRPAKVYRRASAARKVTLPHRDYEQLAALLAEVVHGLDADERAVAVAAAAGERLHEPAGWLATLRERGYEPCGTTCTGPVTSPCCSGAGSGSSGRWRSTA
jgi:predicted ArsR family transcriptional regulator